MNFTICKYHTGNSRWIRNSTRYYTVIESDILVHEITRQKHLQRKTAGPVAYVTLAIMIIPLCCCGNFFVNARQMKNVLLNGGTGQSVTFGWERKMRLVQIFENLPIHHVDLHYAENVSLIIGSIAATKNKRLGIRRLRSEAEFPVEPILAW